MIIFRKNPSIWNSMTEAATIISSSQGVEDISPEQQPNVLDNKPVFSQPSSLKLADQSEPTCTQPSSQIQIRKESINQSNKSFQSNIPTQSSSHHSSQSDSCNSLMLGREEEPCLVDDVENELLR